MMAAALKRTPTCTRCRYHEDIDIPLKGHKNRCPYKECECARCALITKRRLINVAQQELHRQHNPKRSILNTENDQQGPEKKIQANPFPEPQPVSENQSCAVGRIHYYNDGPASYDGGGDHREGHVCYNGVPDYVCVNGEQGDINNNLAYLIRLFPEHHPRYLEYILECYPNDMQTAIAQILPIKPTRQLVCMPGSQFNMHQQYPTTTQSQSNHVSTTQPQLQTIPGAGFVDLYKLVSAQNNAAVVPVNCHSATQQSGPQPPVDYALSLAHSEYAQAGCLQEPRNKGPSPIEL